MKLVIGNKNYSSWSLRAWLVMRELNLPFDEEKISFNAPNWRSDLRALSSAGRVPVLSDGDLQVWDSLAIVEYLADRFPDAGIWPSDTKARAIARAICAEMHAGFSNLRAYMPMNIEARLPGKGWNVDVQADIDRILQIWSETRAEFGADGDMLFGRFCAADAFYAPVVWRFVTHDVSLPPVAAAYANAVRGLVSMKAWEAEALTEHEFVIEDEPYRSPPA